MSSLAGTDESVVFAHSFDHQLLLESQRRSDWITVDATGRLEEDRRLTESDVIRRVEVSDFWIFLCDYPVLSSPWKKRSLA